MSIIQYKEVNKACFQIHSSSSLPKEQPYYFSNKRHLSLSLSFSHTHTHTSILINMIGIMHMDRYYVLPIIIFVVLCEQTEISTVSVDVGVILDSNSIVGQVSNTSIAMALEDFYSKNSNFTTRIVLHNRDSKSDVVEAASAAIDLLKNVRVKAILGPQRSTQADFVTDIGNKAHVPIISLATSPSLSQKENPYFIRVAQNGSSQVEALTAILKAFSWLQVVLISEDNFYGSDMNPYVIDSFLKVNVQVKHRSVLSFSSTDDHILQELYKLVTMQTRVFLVNMSPALASRFFLKAKQIGMMSEGYAWIITDVLTSILDFLDPKVISSMQGVIGLRAYSPQSNELEKFNDKWRKRFRQENPDTDRFELNVFGMWAYDSAQALALAVERAGFAKGQFWKPVTSEKNVTDLAAIGSSEKGPKLLHSISNIRIKGLSGDFHLIDGQLQSSEFEIVNVIGKGERRIGFWTKKYGLMKNVKTSGKNYTTNKEDLGAIIWPGESNVVPRGWDWPTNGLKMRVGVPVKTGFTEFIEVKRDPQTNKVKAWGFCVDLFEEVLKQHHWSYAIPYEFIPYTPDGQATEYNALIYQTYLGEYDIVVGDVTILADRSKYVDFSLPFTESGMSMVVPIRGDERKNAWIFMKPLTTDLWITTGTFFIFTGFVVWVLEHRINKEFRGPPSKQIGIIFWFSFSTMVFAHKEKLISNLSRFVVLVWVFLVLVLTSSYTASLTSMLTVQKLQPTVTDINDLIKNREYVGFQEGSYVDQLLIKMGVEKSMLRNYSTVEEFDEALTKGSKNGGVGAIVDELPYLKLLLTRHCTKYTLVGPTYKTAGLGFAFPKGSPMVAEFSRAILSVMEDNMTRIERKWFGEQVANCDEQTGNRITSDSLTLDSFWGLFLIAGVCSVSALIIFLSNFLYDNRQIICSDEPIKQKLAIIAKNFDQQKDIISNDEESKMKTDGNLVPEDMEMELAVSISHNEEGDLSQDEGLSSATEPGTPMNEIEIVGADDDNDQQEEIRRV